MRYKAPERAWHIAYKRLILMSENRPSTHPCENSRGTEIRLATIPVKMYGDFFLSIKYAITKPMGKYISKDSIKLDNATKDV